MIDGYKPVPMYAILYIVFFLASDSNFGGIPTIRDKRRAGNDVRVHVTCPYAGGVAPMHPPIPSKSEKGNKSTRIRDHSPSSLFLSVERTNQQSIDYEAWQKSRDASSHGRTSIAHPAGPVPVAAWLAGHTFRLSSGLANRLRCGSTDGFPMA
jgi:hypothetical protein